LFIPIYQGRSVKGTHDHVSATSITADKISDSGKDDVLKFTKFYYHFPVPFVIYADFECFLEKSDADHSVMHVPSGFCALMVSVFEEHDYKLHCYSGKNVMDEFYNYMNQEEQRIRTILNQNNAMIELTEDQNICHKIATVCGTCKKEFTAINFKMRHHCHVTGRYIGQVCQSCNLQLKCRTWNNEFFVPCFFHNSSAYDSHLIIKYLHKKESKITVTPSNTEQSIGFG